VCKNINVRHRNAQFAGRASVEYYVGQALKGRVAQEDGFIMRIFSNGFIVFVPRFGIEGAIKVKELSELGPAHEPKTEFDEDQYTLKVDTGKREVLLALFEKVKVEVTDSKEESTGKRKIQMKLLM
jgi:exosome complex exonuclease DIS3/RRP44